MPKSIFPLSFLGVVRVLVSNSCLYRSMQQINERLDRLILQIREIHRPRMNGGTPSDVLLVSPCLQRTPFSSILPYSALPSLPAPETQTSQVAHGLILRCFMKRWLDLSIDFPLPMILAPGAIAVLRYASDLELCSRSVLSRVIDAKKLQEQ